ncbi:hypothetical protein C8F01DRAFT_273735 [Mycena amicta]|nr:hypothetical protein C8F01DRAFT_273735 [Mycena amicta]
MLPSLQNNDHSCTPNANTRALPSLLWSCLVTISACVWVSVHPNVPPASTGRFKFWRRHRIRLSLVGLLAPELIVGFAARQCLAARRLARELDLSRTHAMFVIMGGFIALPTRAPICTKAQLSSEPLVLDKIKSISKEELKDRSKGDLFSMAVAILQLLAFLVVCFARMVQGLPLTQLEIASAAFAVMCMCMRGLWLGKPLEVMCSIGIPMPMGPDLPEQLEKSAGFTGKTTVTNDLFALLSGSYYESFVPDHGASSVPAFFSTTPQEENTADSELAGIVQYLLGAVFGAMHLAAWNSAGGTVERVLWRVAALVVTAVPLVLIGLVWILAGEDGPGEEHHELPKMATFGASPSDFFKQIGRFAVHWTRRTLYGILRGVQLALIPVYIAARALLLVLPFVALRRGSLPADALVDVNWSKWIPDFS